MRDAVCPHFAKWLEGAVSRHARCPVRPNGWHWTRAAQVQPDTHGVRVKLDLASALAPHVWRDARRRQGDTLPGVRVGGGLGR